MSATFTDQLCLNCGLCCNGVLFKDVELQPGDDSAQLAALGLPLKARKSKTAFAQPCHALDGCACRIYSDRPTRCRQFDCALLLAARQGEIEIPEALRVIRDAWRRAAKVTGLLRQLGDANEELALSLRFQRAKKRFEQNPGDETATEVFGELTLAVHDLNLLLQRSFYPLPGD